MEGQDKLTLKVEILALDPSEVIDIEETISDLGRVMRGEQDGDWHPTDFKVDISLVSYSNVGD